MLLCAWFVDLKFREAVLETWSLTYSINVYIGMQLQEPQISNQLGISPKVIHLTLCLWQKNPGFRKNSLCSLICPDFDSFEFANWPLKSSTNFWISWKICFCLWSAQVAYSKAAQECSFRCKFELASPKRPVPNTTQSIPIYYLHHFYQHKLNKVFILFMQIMQFIG